MCLYVWRRVRDSNPEGIAPQLFSRQPDYQLSQLSIFLVGDEGIAPTRDKVSGFTDPRAYFNALIPDIMYGTPPKIRTLTKRVGAAYATVTPEACIYGGGGEIRTPAPSQGPNALAVRPLRPA